MGEHIEKGNVPLVALTLLDKLANIEMKSPVVVNSNEGRKRSRHLKHRQNEKQNTNNITAARINTNGTLYKRFSACNLYNNTTYVNSSGKI